VSAAIFPGAELAERVGFEPLSRLEAKSLQNADLVYDQCLRTRNKMHGNAEK
jgi:hypothetical protein